MRFINMVALLAAAAGSLPATAVARGPAAAISRVEANGISIAHRVVGLKDGRPIVLVAGSEMQLTEWPRELIDGLVRDGFRVVVFDNRDSGGSTHFAASGMPDWAAVFASLATRNAPPLPYAAQDMVQDVFGLMDALRIDRADVLGVSGGATIAELMASTRPARVRSLAVVAANSGNPSIPMPADPARLAGIPQPAASDDAARIAARRLAGHRAMATDGFDEAETARMVAESVRRDADPLGFARQGAALIALGDLRPRLAAIAVPTTVIHGEADPLVSVRSGREVAATIPGAVFLAIPGMGHGLPSRHVPAILSAVKANAGRAK